MNTDQQVELLTVPETAKVLRLTVSTIRAWILQRRLPFVRLGRRVFIQRVDVDALIARSLVPSRAVSERRAA